LLQTHDNSERFFDDTSKPLGISYGKWTVRWWRWAFNIPKSKNPLIDDTGNYANANQRKDVWFLAGKPADSEPYIPQRRCNIPARRAVLFPIINCEANKLEFPELDESGLIENVVTHMEQIRQKECFLDGKKIPVQRVRSDPEIFEIQINSENIFDIPNGGNTTASADGYWVFLKSLEKGVHIIEFHGSCSSGVRFSGSKYILTVS
jgi:hypothetical protein